MSFLSIPCQLLGCANGKKINESTKEQELLHIIGYELFSNLESISKQSIRNTHTPTSGDISKGICVRDMLRNNSA